MTDRDEADRPVRNLHAYFYDFDPTGCDPVDAILEAVARAGKQYHHTQDWGDEDGSGDSCIAHIQDAAEIAATVLREAEQRGMLRAAEIAGDIYSHTDSYTTERLWANKLCPRIAAAIEREAKER